MKKGNAFVFFLLITINVSSQTFFHSVDHFFLTGDLSQVKQYIGKTIDNEVMREVDNKYPGDSIDLSKSKPRLGVSVSTKYSKVLLFSVSSKLVYKKSSYEIWDVKGLKIESGSSVFSAQLMIQAPGSPRSNQVLYDAGGLLVLKEGEPVPVDKKIVPDWIVTVTSDGKIQLSKPKDKTRYIFVPSDN